MRTEVLIAARPGRRPHIEASGGLAVRETRPDTVHLVSTAATPLGGDTVCLRVVVEPGACLRIRTVAASIALPGSKTLESHVLWNIETHGELDVDPLPTIVAAGSRHITDTRLNLSESARVRLRERVQIGRTGERQGFWSGSVHADLDGAPLLRHRTELGPGSVADDALGAPLACVSELHYPDADVPTVGMPLTLARGGCLATWQGDRL
jgi:urease accessory protein